MGSCKHGRVFVVKNMGSQLYGRFIQLTKRWPVDDTRLGRDLGSRLRKLVAENFPKGPVSQVNEEKLSGQLESFSRLANNTYATKYPRRFTKATALGHELELLKTLTSNEAFRILGKDTKYRNNLDKLEEEVKRGQQSK